MNASQLINQDSGNYEYFTPQFIIDAAREAMGGTIHLDPASSQLANERVGALAYFTKEVDGLTQNWHGNVFLNHPFSRINNKRWIDKLHQEWAHGRIQQACCITFAATSEKWFQPLLSRPQCFLHPRTDFYLPDGTKKRGVTKGSVVTYYGPELARFGQAFSQYGTIKL